MCDGECDGLGMGDVMSVYHTLAQNAAAALVVVLYCGMWGGRAADRIYVT